MSLQSLLNKLLKPFGYWSSLDFKDSRPDLFSARFWKRLPNHNNRESLTFRISKHFRWIPTLELCECNDEDDTSSSFNIHTCWLWFTIWLPVLHRKTPGIHRTERREKNGALVFEACESYEGHLRRWGWSLLDDTLHTSWDYSSHYWRLPFISSLREELRIMMPDRHTVAAVITDGPGDFQRLWVERCAAKDAASEQHPYQYIRSNGEKQTVTATCVIERAICRRKWIPFYRQVVDYLDVTFSDEVGEGVDTWKGGCVGCSARLLPGESIETCLRRMETTMKFSR